MRLKVVSDCEKNSGPAGSIADLTAVSHALSRIHAVETNPHPLPAPQPSRQAGDPLPFTNGEGNLRWHRVRVTEQGSETGAFRLSSPRSERGEDQGEGLRKP